MINGNILIAYFISQQLSFLWNLRHVPLLTNTKRKNTRLDNLRKKKRLTLSEQKEFITLKSGKSTAPERFSFVKFTTTFLLYLALFTFIFMFLEYFGINPNFWVTLLALVIISVPLNQIYSKYGIEKQDGIDKVMGIGKR